LEAVSSFAYEYFVTYCAAELFICVFLYVLVLQDAH